MAGPDVEFHGDAVIVAKEGPLSAPIENERVLLDRDEGRYYGLNPVGTRVWEIVQDPTRFRELRKTISMEFGVDSDRCEADLKEFLVDLVSAELVEVTDAEVP